MAKEYCLLAVNNQYFEINMNIKKTSPIGCTHFHLRDTRFRISINISERHLFQLYHFLFFLSFQRAWIFISTCSRVTNVKFSISLSEVCGREREKKENKFGESVRSVSERVSECVNYDEMKWNSLCMWRVWTHLSLPTILYEHAFALGNYLKISSFHAVFACALAFLMCAAYIHPHVLNLWCMQSVRAHWTFFFFMNWLWTKKELRSIFFS